MAGPGKFVVDGATGDVTTIAAPPAPAFIRILSLQLSVTATSTVTFKSGSTQIGKQYLGTGINYSEVDEKNGLMDASPGEAFVIGNSAGTIAGSGAYTILGA
jgi:hypothetical protein